MYSCCVTGFLTWYLVYQSSSLYNNYYVAVINLFLIKNCVLKVYLNILIENIWLVLGLAQTNCKHFKRQPHRVVKHTQTISRQFLCLRFVWVCMTFFVGLVLKGLRMSITTFLLTYSLLMHCYYALMHCNFTRPNVTFYWNLCYSIIPKLKIKFFISIFFYLQVIDFIPLFQGYQRVHISYLSIYPCP